MSDVVVQNILGVLVLSALASLLLGDDGKERVFAFLVGVYTLTVMSFFGWVVYAIVLVAKNLS